MKHINYFFVTILLLQMAAPFAYSLTDQEYYEELEAERAAEAQYNEILKELVFPFRKQIRQELKLVSSGGYAWTRGKKINSVALEFSTNRRVTLDEARALQILVIGKFVEAINANEKIRPFLARYPFSSRNVSLRIFFKENLDKVADSSIEDTLHISEKATAIENIDKIFYYVREDGFTGNSIIVLEEYYDEAVEQLKTYPVENPAIHKTSEKEKLFVEILSNCRENLEEEYRLECQHIGGPLRGDIKEVGAHFTISEKATKDEARQLIVEVTKKILAALNQNEEIRPYLEQYPFPSSKIKIFIGFRKDNGYSYADVSIEDVILENNQLTYSELKTDKNKFGDSVIVGSESYEEALQKVDDSPLSINKFRPRSALGALFYWLYTLISYLLYQLYILLQYSSL